MTDTLAAQRIPAAPIAESGSPWRASLPLVGVLGVAALFVWLATTGLLALQHSADLWRTITQTQWRYVEPALVTPIALVLVAERIWPAEARRFFCRAHLVDAGYFALFVAIVAPALTLFDTGFGIVTRADAHFLILGRLPVLPRVGVVLLILVGIDAMNFVAHVANHRSPSLWRLHALHHSQEEMSVLTTFRTHPLVHATYFPALLPALVLGASGAVPASGFALYAFLITLPHANLRWNFGPFGRVFVSPAFHRLHHDAAPVDNKSVNFGFVLVCWDRLAGTARFPNGAVVSTGIAGRPVPIEQTDEKRLVRTMLAQMTQPFTRHPAVDPR